MSTIGPQPPCSHVSLAEQLVLVSSPLAPAPEAPHPHSWCRHRARSDRGSPTGGGLSAPMHHACSLLGKAELWSSFCSSAHLPCPRSGEKPPLFLSGHALPIPPPPPLLWARSEVLRDALPGLPSPSSCLLSPGKGFGAVAVPSWKTSLKPRSRGSHWFLQGRMSPQKERMDPRKGRRAERGEELAATVWSVFRIEHWSFPRLQSSLLSQLMK